MEKDQNKKITVHITKNHIVRIVTVIFFIIAIMSIICSTFNVTISKIDGFNVKKSDESQQAASYDFYFDVYGQRIDSLTLDFSNMPFLENQDTYRAEIISPDGSKSVLIEEKAELYENEQTTLTVGLFLEAGEDYILRLTPNNANADNTIIAQSEKDETEDINFWLYSEFTTFDYSNLVVSFIAVFLCLIILLLRINMPRPYQIAVFGLQIIFSMVILFVGFELLNKNWLFDLQNNALLLAFAVYLLIVMILFSLTGRMRPALYVTNSIIFIFGLASYYIYNFRGTPLTPIDIYDIKTAASVSKQYLLFIDKTIIIAFVDFVCSVIIVSSIRCQIRGGVKKKIAVRAAVFTFSLVTLVFFASHDFIETYGSMPNEWDQMESVKSNGQLVNFLSNIHYLSVKKPDGYSVDTLEEEMQTYTSDEIGEISSEPTEERPNVLFIMNESLVDFQYYDILETSEPVMPYMTALSEDTNTIYGNVVVPVFGARTCNSEFEALTSSFFSFDLTGSPFQLYVRGHISSITEPFNQMGYKTIGFHPYPADNWNRGYAYPLMGFSEFISIESLYEDDIYVPMVRSFPSDEFTFSYMTTLIEETEEPLFLFTVTVQNHGNYNVPHFESTVEITEPIGVYPLAEQYLTLTNLTDEAFGQLISYLQESSEPTVVVMFGDHLPNIEEEFLEQVLPEGDYFAMYTTQYVIWSNYEIKNKTVENGETFSSSYLAPVLMEYIGLPLTSHYKLLLEAKSQFPVISVSGSQDAEGNIVNKIDEWSDEPVISLLYDIQYNHLFDTKKRLEALFKLVQ